MLGAIGGKQVDLTDGASITLDGLAKLDLRNLLNNTLMLGGGPGEKFQAKLGAVTGATTLTHGGIVKIAGLTWDGGAITGHQVSDVQMKAKAAGQGNLNADITSDLAIKKLLADGGNLSGTIVASGDSGTFESKFNTKIGSGGTVDADITLNSSLKSLKAAIFNGVLNVDGVLGSFALKAVRGVAGTGVIGADATIDAESLKALSAVSFFGQARFTQDLGAVNIKPNRGEAGTGVIGPDALIEAANIKVGRRGEIGRRGEVGQRSGHGVH